MEASPRPWWRKRSSKLLLASAALLSLMTAYPLSLGPALYCEFRGSLPPEVQHALNVAYAPLFWRARYPRGPVPWWPRWYAKYIDTFEAAGIKAYYASPQWQAALRYAEREANRRQQEAEAARQPPRTQNTSRQ